MALDLGDKAIIREIAYEVAVPLTEKLQAAVKDGMKTEVRMHALECPRAEEIKGLQDELLDAKARIKGAWGTACVIAVVVSAVATVAVELLRK